MQDNYIVSFEIAGPAAMFTRPDTGSTPVSYPVPTRSAAIGMFDAVLRRPHMYVQPTLVEICKPVRFERFITNYGGPLRKPAQITGNNNFQLIATILVDVCYRIYGEVHIKQMSTHGRDTHSRFKRTGRDWRSDFTRIFDERLATGQTFHTTSAHSEARQKEKVVLMALPFLPSCAQCGNIAQRSQNSFRIGGLQEAACLIYTKFLWRKN